MNLKVYLLNVGHGDSIVIKFGDIPNDKWGVIDCHKPTKNVESPTLQLLKTNNVQQLEFICLTHPDYDHFSGLSELITHFTNNNSNIINYFDYGLDLNKLTSIFSTERDHNSFKKLYNLIVTLCSQDRINYNTLAFNTKFYENNQISMISLGPCGKDLIKYSKLSLKRSEAYKTSKIFEEPNKNLLSVITAIDCQSSNTIFCSDATKENIESSVQGWKKIKKGENYKFDFIKVSHHGSKTNNHIGLWKDFTKHNKAFAGISSGEKYDVPNKEVIESIISNEISLYCTNYSGYLQNLFHQPKLINPINRPINSIKLGLDSVSKSLHHLTPMHGNIEYSDNGNATNIQTEFNNTTSVNMLIP